MTERKPGGEPKIGPYTMQVPPPSTNGSRVEHGTSFDPLRQALPGAIIAVVLALTAVPRIALLHAPQFAQWWRLLIAALAGGAVVGGLQRRSVPVAAVLGATANVIALFIAYGLVRNDPAVQAGTGTVVGDLALLLAWSAVAGGGAAAISFAVRRSLERRAGARTVKATFPRPN